MSFPGYVQGIASFAEATSYDSFQQTAADSTTSNGWVETAKFDSAESVLDGRYSVQWSMELEQSRGGRNMGIQISFRPGDDGDANAWEILNSNDTLQVSSNNASIQHSGFVEVELLTEDVYQVRVEFGQTVSGGTQFVREIDVVVFRVGDI